MKRDASELYHRIEKYWLKELQLKKPSFARAVWKAENPAMVVIIVRVVKSLGNLESYISDKFIFLVTRIFFFENEIYFLTLVLVWSMVAATMNFISLSFIGLLIDWFGDNEVLGTTKTSILDYESSDLDPILSPIFGHFN